MIRLRTLILAALLAAPFTSLLSEEVDDQWYKGNTHTHTLWSDGNDFPESAAAWYKDNGYDFLVLSDHNILSRGVKWKRIDKHIREHGILERHVERWGKGQLELKEEDGVTKARLKTLDEVRALVEGDGDFLMIEGLEITSVAGGATHPRLGLPVHSNAMNVDTVLLPTRQATVEQQFKNHEKLVTEYAQGVEHPVFWHINHPNFKYSNTAEQVAKVLPAHGLEIFNVSGGCNNDGDGTRPGVERIWDIVNTIRIKELGVGPLFGCATDDTHNYHTPEEHYHSHEVLHDAPGLAWVMVRAEELSADAITRAMVDGDFYSSTGVSLETLVFDEEEGTLSVGVKREEGVNYRIRFIGSPRDVSLRSKKVKTVVDERGIKHPVTREYRDSRLGMLFEEVIGSEAVYTLSGDELYVRAVVISDEENVHRTSEGAIVRKAWTQPFICSSKRN
ncbi:hypothetical protein [Pelagicoccus mobilis]|uniref:Polymerase/histidinol phosphatase N-terminal domain-containing protein n=1 Tax=Pelagicoccus mobilis TaxID=415221 RepID=A0A934VJX1_9BACT|nr:hypothetical protein [Pelagicoccus mobilis]MBK1876066.1 hypothetical protein [Pelagicoccus mobilis]